MIRLLLKCSYPFPPDSLLYCSGCATISDETKIDAGTTCLNMELNEALIFEFLSDIIFLLFLIWLRQVFIYPCYHQREQINFGLNFNSVIIIPLIFSFVKCFFK